MRINYNPRILCASLVFLIVAAGLYVSVEGLINPPSKWAPDLYLFPSVIFGCMSLLSLLLFFNQDEIKSTEIRTLLPGLGLIVVYLIAMKYVGFYATSLIMFFAVLMFYSKQEETTDFWRASILKLVVSLAFTVVLYMLFTMLLNVNPPKGLFL